MRLYAIFLLFIFLHELGHGIIGMILKQKLEFLEIMPLGFSIRFLEEYDSSEGKRRKNIKKMVIALAGPAVNITIAFFVYLLDKTQTDIIYTNIVLAGFNLLPIYPLDGGRILEAIFDIHLEYQKKCKWVERTTKIAMVIITIIGSIFVFYDQNIAVFFIILYLWWRILKK